MQILWGKGLSLPSPHCCYTWPQVFHVTVRFQRGWWLFASPFLYTASHSTCLLPCKSSLAEVFHSLFFPTLHLHLVFPSCAGLLRWLLNADGGEAVLFMWPVLPREAVDVRIIMPFQTDCLSHWNVTSTDRAQASAYVCGHMCEAGSAVRWTEPR